MRSPAFFYEIFQGERIFRPVPENRLCPKYLFLWVHWGARQEKAGKLRSTPNRRSITIIPQTIPFCQRVNAFCPVRMYRTAQTTAIDSPIGSRRMSAALL